MWKLFFPAFSYLLFAAHVLFHGFPLLMTVSAAMMILLCFRKHRWVRLLSVAVLLCMGCEWLRAGWQLIEMRMFYGEPWMRAAAIMSAAAFFTWGSAIVFLRGNELPK